MSKGLRSLRKNKRTSRIYSLDNPTRSIPAATTVTLQALFCNEVLYGSSWFLLYEWTSLLSCSEGQAKIMNSDICFLSQGGKENALDPRKDIDCIFGLKLLVHGLQQLQKIHQCKG